MSIQIYSDGACVRIEKNDKSLLIAKDQVKAIDKVQENVVRIDIGEGELRGIYVNYQDVSYPEVVSADNLRDEIRDMLLQVQDASSGATEETQSAILSQLSSIEQYLEQIRNNALDFSKEEPSRMDENDPNTVYKGWHNNSGNPDGFEWAIKRVQKVNGETIVEWAYATKSRTNKWIDRTTLPYGPMYYGSGE